MVVDKDFSSDPVDQMAMSASGGYWHCPGGRKRLVMRFPTVEHARAYESLRKKMAKTHENDGDNQ
ncbi:hypothetical protein NOM01_04360 [Sporolactobacillus sp. STSJ-5]|uniref:hypothetical protein n=1 Tax=Sporolactobacillus sp. STSJ-5 TaxID=2965076 RepID=UPI002106F5BE|nr:hypothetical protein [Sporolactobacillus sp. STSJ-5]MCQ2009226.1 hypothetical protein [Sporolactobacillus sp. STSJ-5]